MVQAGARGGMRAVGVSAVDVSHVAAALLTCLFFSNVHLPTCLARVGVPRGAAVHDPHVSTALGRWWYRDGPTVNVH